MLIVYMAWIYNLYHVPYWNYMYFIVLHRFNGTGYLYANSTDEHAMNVITDPKSARIVFKS